MTLKHLPVKPHSHIGYTCLTFLRYEVSYVPSNCLPESSQTYRGHICISFLHCVYSNASSNHPFQRNLNCIGDNCIFPLCVLSNVSLKHFDERTQMYKYCICLTFPPVWFQMQFQTACLNKFRFTQVTFVCSVFYVRFQMSVEITCTNWFIATLGAFVWFFSRMLFQMAPQWTWPISSKFTLAALVSLFFYSSFCFKLNRMIGWKVWWKVRV